MKKIKAFSLAELMIVMLILTIILAATMPILSKRAKVKAAAVANVNILVKSEGDSCPPGNVAVSPDGTLLTCQGGTFKKPSGGGTGQALYLYANTASCGTYTCSYYPPSCPSTWTDAGLGYDFIREGTNGYDSFYIRSCYHKDNTCQTLYLHANTASCGTYTCTYSPPSCPSGWTSAGVGYDFLRKGTNGYDGFYVRSCYKCS